jgi:hypothetical protein
MGTIERCRRARRLQDSGRLKSSIIRTIAEILIPIIVLSHICPESASNHKEIIDATSARSPQNWNDSRVWKNKEIADHG